MYAILPYNYCYLYYILPTTTTTTTTTTTNAVYVGVLIMMSVPMAIHYTSIHTAVTSWARRGFRRAWVCTKTRSDPLLSNPHEFFAGNEQSIEAIHVKYNKEARRFRQAKNTALRLKRMMASIACTPRATPAPNTAILARGHLNRTNKLTVF